jgi:DNA-binding transcriptional LysR family regulator
MNIDLNEVSVFIKVVETGSFSQAARLLAMPNSTVSSKVSSLEKRLGVTLIQRTTRRLNVTPAGHAYFKRCLQGLHEIQTGETELAASQGEPQGLLRITAPIELGVTVLPEIVAQFTAAYPKVSIEVILSDRRVDLLAENVDLAIRAGELKDSTLKAKKIGWGFFAPYASPKYLKAHGTPLQPKDLSHHACLLFTPIDKEKWKFSNGKTTVSAPIKSQIEINNLLMLRTLATIGTGIALMPGFFCGAEVKSKQLVRLLPEWKAVQAPIHFVHPAQRFVTPTLSAFMNMAGEALRLSLQTGLES